MRFLRKSRVASWAIAIAGVLVVPPGVLILYIFLANWNAERRARAFCEEIQVGSDISVAIKRFEKEIGKPDILHYGGSESKGEDFLFLGAMLDKADCSVATDEQGKVISKITYMLYD